MIARTVSAAAAVVVLTAGSGLAQSRGPILPAEMPPASYTAAQYVDSRGCIFIRAGFDGRTTWVPRLGNDRQPMCGGTPSLAAGAAPAVSPAVVPVASAPAPRAQPAPQPVRSAPVAVQVGGVPYSVPPEPSRPRAAGRVPTTYVQQASGQLDTRWSFFDRTGPSPCTNLSPHSQMYMVPSPEAPELPLRCGPQMQHPVDAMREMSPRGAVWEPWNGVNPSPTAPNVYQLPPTYAPRWPQGSMAPGPQSHALPPSVGPSAPAVRVSSSGSAAAVAATRGTQTASVTQPVGQGRYVQVGTFGVPSNAQATVARLQSQGLPVVVGRSGANLQVVMAGPFATQAEIQQALGAARAMGIRDAFVR